MPETFGPNEFRQKTGVDDTVLVKLELYVQSLIKWQKAINLIGPQTIETVWHRHMWDSAQLSPLLPPNTNTLVDLGSGAGFPGLVLAIMGVPQVHLIESDHRKAAFLSHVSRETQVDVTVHAQRIESVTPFVADVITARALAPLPKLLTLARPFIGPNSECLLLKGQYVVAELTETTKCTNMTVERIPSKTEPSATILRLKGITYGG